MIRYARQPTKSSCGPTAIINAIKWAGYKCSIKSHHTFLSRLCNTNAEDGTEALDFSRALKKLVVGPGPTHNISIWTRHSPKAKDIVKCIKENDCAAIILYYFKSPNKSNNVEGHYTLLTDVSIQGEITCINDVLDKTVSSISMNDLRSKLSLFRSNKEDHPQVWFIKRSKL
jgi:hypothetical protein